MNIDYGRTKATDKIGVSVLDGRNKDIIKPVHKRFNSTLSDIKSKKKNEDKLLNADLSLNKRPYVIVKDGIDTRTRKAIDKRNKKSPKRRRLRLWNLLLRPTSPLWRASTPCSPKLPGTPTEESST